MKEKEFDTEIIDVRNSLSNIWYQSLFTIEGGVYIFNILVHDNILIKLYIMLLSELLEKRLMFFKVLVKQVNHITEPHL